MSVNITLKAIIVNGVNQATSMIRPKISKMRICVLHVIVIQKELPMVESVIMRPIPIKEPLLVNVTARLMLLDHDVINVNLATTHSLLIIPRDVPNVNVMLMVVFCIKILVLHVIPTLVFATVNVMLLVISVIHVCPELMDLKRPMVKVARPVGVMLVVQYSKMDCLSVII